MLLSIRTAARIANRTAEVAGVRHFDQRDTAMLLMVRTEATVIRACPTDRRIPPKWHLRRLEVNLAALTVVVDVVGDEHTLGSVVWAVLEHPHPPLFENDLAVNLAEALRADRHDGVVEKVRTRCGWHWKGQGHSRATPGRMPIESRSDRTPAVAVRR